MKHISSSLFVPVLVCLSGAAALSWEGIWQIRSTLALGVSGYGAALTLAVTMGGMGLGSFLMGAALKGREPQRPLRLYGLLEIVIGLCGLMLAPLFRAVEAMDTQVYAMAPGMAPLAHVAGVVLALSVPALCMGATFPVIGLVARQYGRSLAGLYGLNTLGAAAGILAATFIVIPAWGVAQAGFAIAAMNFAVGALAFLPVAPSPQREKRKGASDIEYIVRHVCRLSARMFGAAQVVSLNMAQRAAIACTTGFAVFALEIAWFRSLTATFQSTTYAFAIMLASVLLALGQAASMVGMLKRNNVSPGVVLAVAGALILLATPMVENLDLFVAYGHGLSAGEAVTAAAQAGLPEEQAPLVMLLLFAMSYVIVGIPMVFLGVGFPWVVEDKTTPGAWGALYAVNTVSAIAGATVAAWILLPSIGFVRTACLVGLMVAAVGVVMMPGARRRVVWGMIVCGALAVAVMHGSGAGRTRVLAAQYYGVDGDRGKLLQSFEGPSSTAAVVEYANGERRLIIDGASASTQGGTNGLSLTHYLNWMGSLPMLAHAGPRDALVICFGTGQTANAARKEGLQSLDIVDIEPSVYKLAHHFSANENILADPAVTPVVMDGRAFMRRVQKSYDVITLEPMPPNMAGVNALYSREFYEHAHERLRDGGIIAQWLPFRSLTPYYAASIARTFIDVFPNAVLWVDPVDNEGILLGVKGDGAAPGASWPGFARTQVARNMTQEEVAAAVVLNPAQLAEYGAAGTVITDDNQLLAYGANAQSAYTNFDFLRVNMDVLNRMTE